jgi:hypothetical protein
MQKKRLETVSLEPRSSLITILTQFRQLGVVRWDRSFQKIVRKRDLPCEDKKAQFSPGSVSMVWNKNNEFAYIDLKSWIFRLEGCRAFAAHSSE